MEVSEHRLSDWSDPPPDEWVVDEELPDGAKEQTEWAVEGVFAVLERKITSRSGAVSKSEFASSFAPWPNRYALSPDVAQEIAPDVFAAWQQGIAERDAEGETTEDE